MKKRLIGLLMALALCLSLLPAMALAAAPSVDVDGEAAAAGYVAPNELWVGGTNVVAGGYWTTNEDGSLTVSDSNNYNVYYDGDGNLWLNNANIVGQGSSGHAATGIYAYYDEWVDTDIALTIHLAGENSVSRGYPIYVHPWGGSASLTITGQGSLNATATVGGNGGIFVHGDTSSLTIENGADVTVNSARSSAVTIVADAQGMGTLTLDNATLRAYGHVIDEPDESYSICFSYSGNSDNIVDGSRVLRLSGNSVIYTDYMQATYTRLVIEASENEGGMIFDGKNGTVYGNVTLQEDLTIGEGKSLTIPDGSSLDMGGHIIIVEKGGKLDGTPIGDGAVIDKSLPVSYLDENGTEQSCSDYEVVTANDTQWTDGWYVVCSDVTIDRRVDVSDDVKLILTDGHALTVNGGIHVTGDDRFTVYGQENGTGKLTATATNHVGAGIGGNGSTTTSAQDGENGGTIIIAGGTIEAVGGDGADDSESPCGGAGIGNGGGPGSDGGSIAIYGGMVNATGGVANAGIGGNGSTIQISGGTVEATSGGAGTAAIGGTHSTAGTITITESNVTANSTDGTGIGGGWQGDGGAITITNSTVTASGGQGAGIGGGWQGNGGTITITDSNITADSNTGAGIGGGYGEYGGGNGGNVTIVNSTVTASSKEGDSIGAGKDGTDPGTLTLSPAGGMAIAAKAGADEAGALTLNGSPFTAETVVTDLVRGTRYFHSETNNITDITVITAQPQNMETKETETAAFTVEATGIDLSYQWQQSTDNGNSWTNIDGATGDTYTTEKTTMDMNGYQYRCVVKNSINEVTSDAVTLTVKHDLEKVEAKAPTCTEAGNKEYWTCKTCGKCFSDAEGKVEITQADTVIPAAGHKLTKTEAKAATCTEAGNEAYWTCETCGKYFSDGEGKEEITLDSTVLPALGHDYQDGVCTRCEGKDPDYVPPTDPEAPAQTGETAQVGLWFFLMTVSMASIAVMTVLRRQKHRA